MKKILFAAMGAILVLATVSEAQIDLGLSINLKNDMHALVEISIFKKSPSGWDINYHNPYTRGCIIRNGPGPHKIPKGLIDLGEGEYILVARVLNSTSRKFKLNESNYSNPVFFRVKDGQVKFKQKHPYGGE